MKFFQNLESLNLPKMPSKMKANESEAISEVETLESLVHKFERCGIELGDTLFVHASLSSFGYVVGGIETLLDALLLAVGDNGTIVVPSFTGNNSDPARWRAPPVASEEVRSKILESCLPFNSKKSMPWSRLGSLPKEVVCRDNAVRSFHPQFSFAGIGKKATQILSADKEKWDLPFDDKGVLGSLLHENAKILFLGTGWKTCTALHLLEMNLYGNSSSSVFYDDISCVLKDGKKCYVKYKLMELKTDDFEEIGARLEKENPEIFGARKLTLKDKKIYYFEFASLMQQTNVLLEARNT